MEQRGQRVGQTVKSGGVPSVDERGEFGQSWGKVSFGGCFRYVYGTFMRAQLRLESKISVEGEGERILKRFEFTVLQNTQDRQSFQE